MLKNTKYGFASEDSTRIVKKITYHSNTNSFVGFCTPLDDGIPIEHYFRTESFQQLKQWFADFEKAALSNLHMVQPISPDNTNVSPFILSAYGIDNNFKLYGVIRKWIFIFNECSTRNIRIIGFATSICVSLLHGKGLDMTED